ncbi:hypothetical protein ACFYQ5_35105 [Streptomyces sp. NPDC005794]|uniref:hypothetical protein n=1 Tax=Streptomyces sp. NPDC005794 TaxID=3364733 RepID=UPI0036B1120E
MDRCRGNTGAGDSVLAARFRNGRHEARADPGRPLNDLGEGWWNTAGDIAENLTAYGLPATPAGLRAYMGLPSADQG